MNQRLTIIGGEAVFWSQRGNSLVACHRGHSLSVDIVLPRPEALTEDRVVVAMTRRVFRPVLNGQPADGERDFFPSMDEALDSISRALTETLLPLEAAMAEYDAAAGGIRYEDWA